MSYTPPRPLFYIYIYYIYNVTAAVTGVKCQHINIQRVSCGERAVLMNGDDDDGT